MWVYRQANRALERKGKMESRGYSEKPDLRVNSGIRRSRNVREPKQPDRVVSHA